MGHRKKTLRSVEGLAALDPDQFVMMPCASVVTAPGNLGGAQGHVFVSEYQETCLYDEPLVLARRDKEEIANRAARCDLLVRQGASDHDRIGVEDTAARLQDAVPLPQDQSAIAKVIHGVDADNAVEHIGPKRKTFARINELESSQQAKRLGACHLVRSGYPLFVHVDPYPPGAKCASQEKCGATRATCDFQNARGRGDFQPPQEIAPLVGGQPAILTDILAVGFQTNLLLDLGSETAVRSVVVINFLSHYSLHSGRIEVVRL